MPTQWMKHALIVSVLTVLMILPATAQQRRLSGPAKPAAGTPGKLEVPPKLRPLVQRAIRATLQLQKARLEVLQVVKQLERLAATADQSSGVTLPTAPTADKSSMVEKSFRVTGGDVTFTAADGKAPHISQTTDRIKAGVLQAVAIPAFLRFVEEAGHHIMQGPVPAFDGALPIVVGDRGGQTTSSSQMIVVVQKAIQDPVLRMEGNSVIWGQTIAK